MVDALISVLMDRILRELSSSVLQMNYLSVELTQLKESLCTMNTLLGDAVKKLGSGEIRTWLETVVDVLYEIDDSLKTAAWWQTRMNLNKLSKVWMSIAFATIHSPKLSQKFKKVTGKLGYLIAEAARFHFAKTPLELNLNNSVTQPTISPTVREQIIGREEEKNTIVKLLIDSDPISIISIVGMGGIGKSTLARLVYNDETVKAYFELKAWVCVSKMFDAALISKRIVESILCFNHGGIDIHQAPHYLRKALDGRKFLLVLDDVWEESGAMKSLLKGVDGIPGSRVLITTCSSYVAETTSTVSPFVLRGLDEDKSWLLFKHKAFQSVEEPSDSATVNIGKEIVKKCAGVPFAIMTIGSLLFFENSKSQWLLVNHELEELTHLEFNLLLKSILRLSYCHLPPYLKVCFLCCAIFPKGSTIEVDFLIKLWMANGFVHSITHNHTPEDVGHETVMELVGRGFFQKLQQDEWGAIVSVKIHDLIHDLAQYIAGPCFVSFESHIKEDQEAPHHVSFNFDSAAFWQYLTICPQAHKLQTLLNSKPWLPFKCKSFRLNWKSLFQALENCKGLRFLDLRGLGMKMVPSSLGDLKYLRYLDLSENTMDELPSSITTLMHLETLRLSYCHSLKKLPAGIENLVKLRHLMLDGCDNLHYMPCGLGQLTSLQVLPRFVVAKGQNSMTRHSGKLQELSGMNNLRGKLEILNLECLEQLKDFTVEAEAANLKDKQHLQLLALNWCRQDDDSGDIYKDEMLFENLSPHQNLHEFSIKGFGGLRFPGWCSSLTNLVSLALHNCPGCKYLPPLHQYSSLKYLELVKMDSLEFMFDGGVKDKFPPPPLPQAEIFQSLMKLTILDCCNLKGWWKEDAFNDVGVSFHCISMIEIKYCPQLISIPLYANIDEELILVDVSVKVLEQTMMTMSTGNMTAKQYPPAMAMANSSTFFSTPSAALSKLKSLHIANVEDLESFPYEGLRNLTSLQSLYISECVRLKALSHGIEHLSSLVYLKIRDCKQLDLCSKEEDNMLWKGLRSLRSLTIWGPLKGNSLPIGFQHLTSLQFFHLQNCSHLEALPEWIGSLTSLKRMVISKCYKLTSLPHGLHALNSLHTLIISECPLLMPRCQRETGEDWFKIAHIPNFSISAVVKDYF